VDLALKSKVDEVLATRPRKFVRASDVLAVIDRESHGVLVFKQTDQLYKDNLHAAHKITGISEADIIATMVIKDGPFKGQVSKFRCEPGYWQWAQKYAKVFKPTELLLLSCSFGLGQKMSRWLITGMATNEWLDFIRHFMGSASQQIAYCAGDVDQLLSTTGGERAVAFARYNAGPGAKKDGAAYKNYGLPVAANAARIKIQLGEK